MRDPKAHAKILAKRSKAARHAWRDALDQGDRLRGRRVEILILRLEQLSDLNYTSTGWRYIIERYGPAYWRHLEFITDTEEDAQ